MIGPKYPNFGREVRIEQKGCEVHLIFVASNMIRANAVVDDLLAQLKSGALHITLSGTPSHIVER